VTYSNIVSFYKTVLEPKTASFVKILNLLNKVMCKVMLQKFRHHPFAEVRTSHARTEEPLADGNDTRLVPTDSSLLMGTSAGYGGGLPRDATGARFYWQMALRSESQALPIAIIR
jgi:hypothetical protein